MANEDKIIGREHPLIEQSKKMSADLDDLSSLIHVRMNELDAALLDRDKWRNEARILQKQNELRGLSAIPTLEKRITTLARDLEKRNEELEKVRVELRRTNNLDQFTYVITLTLENLRSLTFHYTLALAKNNTSIAGGRHTLDKIWSALIEHHIMEDIERHK